MDKLITSAAFIFYALAIAGMFFHAVKKKAYGELIGGLIDWYVVNPWASVWVLLSCLGAVVAAILGGHLTDINNGNQIVEVFTIGFGIDAFNNQGKKS